MLFIPRKFFLMFLAFLKDFMVFLFFVYDRFVRFDEIFSFLVPETEFFL